MTASLSNIPAGLLPATVTEPIFAKAQETSAVMQLARKVPLAMTAQTSIPVPMDVPVAGWVSEGGSKPAGSASVGVKQMQGKKVALLLPVSQEVATSNAAGLYEQLKQDLPTAISRAFDHAAIHGKDLRTGGSGPFADYVLQTSNSVELGTKTQANGGVYADLVVGEKAVVDAGYDFSGFAADPRLRPTLKLQVDTQGRPIWVDDPAVGTNGGSLVGYPTFYNRGVSGSYRRHGNRVQVITLTNTPTGGTFTVTYKNVTSSALAYNITAANLQTAVRGLSSELSAATVTGSASGPYTVTLSPVSGASGPLAVDGSALTGAGDDPVAVVAQSSSVDSGLRAIGGDWSQCAWGEGMAITMKVSTEASYVDENDDVHSAFQDNLVLLLIEAYYGFVVGDPDAFVAYTDAA